MKFNRVRTALISFNLFFVILITLLHLVAAPLIHKQAERFLVNAVNVNLMAKTNYIIESIETDSLKHNFGLTTYMIPKRRGELMTDTYHFVIINDNGNLIYATDEYSEKVDYRDYNYIYNAFYERDTITGKVISSLTSRPVYYIISRQIIKGDTYLLLYEIDVEYIKDEVLEFLFPYYLIIYIFFIMILVSSYYMDKQYQRIYTYQHDIIDSYKIIDNTSLLTAQYIRRIKKVLHTYSFTTAILFAINEKGDLLFRNKAAQDAIIYRYGQDIRLSDIPKGNNLYGYKKSWNEKIVYLFKSNDTNVEWDFEAYDNNGKRFYTNNRARKIFVDGIPIIICEIQDVTETMNAKNKIKEYTNYLETILNTVNEVILTTDKNDNIVDVNSKVNDKFGYKVEDILGKNLSVILETDLEFDEKSHTICDGRKSNGDIIICEIYKDHLLLPNDEYMSLYAITDVTERETMKQTLFKSIAITTEAMSNIAGKI